MNREVLFRGKSINSNKWHFGTYIAYESGEACILSQKFSRYGYEATEICYRHKVDPSTLGQYTGLTDRNGVKIFEGDIVKGKVHVLYGYRIVKAAVVYDTVGSRFALEYGSDFKNIPFECEVIGNIHDNPELLQKMEENNE